MEKTTPKYMELVGWINEQIETKKLVPGQKMYSENTLKDMFGVSRQTVGTGRIRSSRSSLAMH